ncbi:MAG TPA: 1,4-alpha-glucan branching protein domain-containing protein, partial [Thermodesulfovibrionales bacterium]|nr:1,4-alpha-glucan branching protein domain-containing protein [Thermodesulfovibrionales bacterium]
YIGPYVHRDGIRVDTGFKYYRITGKTHLKEPYVPELAAQKAEAHAGNFLFNRQRQIERFASVMDRRPIIVAPYDAELFGHWWFEGPLWIEHLLRKIHKQKTIRLVTLSGYLEEYPVNQVCTPSASSWGNKGFSETWCNSSNDWIIRHLYQGTLSMEKLATGHPRARGPLKRALNQAARELLLAQASDWAFMINSGAVEGYAARRARTHLLRLARIKREIEEGKINMEKLAAVETTNNIFPRIDYRVLSSRPKAPNRTGRHLRPKR